MTPIIRLFVVAAAMFAASAQGQIINESLSGSGASQPGGAPGNSEEPAASPLSWMIPKVTLPKLTLPKIEMPKMPADALAPVKSSAQKVKDGARKAWEGTKEIFAFGRGGAQGDARVASREQPSVFQRMFGGEPPRDEPQDIVGFMSQPRPE